MSTLSAADAALLDRFASLQLLPPDLDHRAHVRVGAAIVLCHGDGADVAMRDGLIAILKHLGAHGPDTPYHETLTIAWIRLLRARLTSTGATDTEALLAACPDLLDKHVLDVYYSRDVLFSDAAKTTFVEPDLRRFEDDVG